MIKPEYPNQMQVYFITRGKDNAIKEWIKHLSAKWFPYQYNNQNGLLEGILRPVQLWEFGFPKEHKDLVFNTLFDGQPGAGTHQSDWKGNLGLKAICKALNAQPLGEWNLSAGKMVMPSRAGMSVMGIGYRKDKTNIHPATGVPNEGI